MSNGKCYRPYRIPGKYCCIICRDLKDAEEFYKDSSRYNGCGSRCKSCDNQVREARRDPTSQSFVGSAEALSRRQIKKRTDEILNGTVHPEKTSSGEVVHYNYLNKDEYGRPTQVEKTYYENGVWIKTEFERL